MRVFVFQHEHELDGYDEVKFIGVYSTARRGRAAVARAKRLPGFRDHPGGFSVDAREVDVRAVHLFAAWIAAQGT